MFHIFWSIQIHSSGFHEHHLKAITQWIMLYDSHKAISASWLHSPQISPACSLIFRVHPSADRPATFIQLCNGSRLDRILQITPFGNYFPQPSPAQPSRIPDNPQMGWGVVWFRLPAKRHWVRSPRSAVSLSKMPCSLMTWIWIHFG